MLIIPGINDSLEPGSLAVQTRQGSDIKNSLGRHWTDFERKKETEFFEKLWKPKPLPKERKRPSCVYNCHGMTFMNRRAEINEQSVLLLILKEDEYYEINENDAMPGDIAVYTENKEITHTGIVISNDPMPFGPSSGTMRCPIILSKWGKGGEYIHRYNDCPYWNWNGVTNSVITYMREGKND